MTWLRIVSTTAAAQAIVLPTGYPRAVPGAPKGIAATILHTFALMVARQLVFNVPSARGLVALQIVTALCQLAVTSNDFSKAAHMIEAVHAQTAPWIADGGLERQDTPPSVQLHHYTAMSPGDLSARALTNGRQPPRRRPFVRRPRWTPLLL